MATDVNQWIYVKISVFFGINTYTFNVESCVLILKKAEKEEFIRIPIDLQILPRILSALIIKEPN